MQLIIRNLRGIAFLICILMSSRLKAQVSEIVGGWHKAKYKVSDSHVNDCSVFHFDSLVFYSGGEVYAFGSRKMIIYDTSSENEYTIVRQKIYHKGVWEIIKQKKKIRPLLVLNLQEELKGFGTNYSNYKYRESNRIVMVIDSIKDNSCYFTTFQCESKRGLSMKRGELPNFKDSWEAIAKEIAKRKAIKENNRIEKQRIQDSIRAIKKEFQDSMTAVSRKVFAQHPKRKNKLYNMSGVSCTVLMKQRTRNVISHFLYCRIIDFNDSQLVLDVSQESYDTVDFYYYVNTYQPNYKKINWKDIENVTYTHKREEPILTSGILFISAGVANSLVFAQLLSINYKKNTFNKGLWEKFQLGSIGSTLLGTGMILCRPRERRLQIGNEEDGFAFWKLVKKL